MQTNTREPIRPARILDRAISTFVSLLWREGEKKNQAEITAVKAVRISSPSEELKPNKNGDAYKFGLKSHPPIRSAGKFNSRQINRTNHTERTRAVVVIHLWFLFAVQYTHPHAKNKQLHDKQTIIRIIQVSTADEILPSIVVSVTKNSAIVLFARSTTGTLYSP